MSSARRRGAFRPRRWAWLLLLAALLAPAYDLLLPAGPFPPRQRRTVIIDHGQSLHAIAQELQRVGVIRSSFGFLALARLMHLDRGVKAGQYSFRLGTTVPALLRALGRGMYGLDLLTIPEGLTAREISGLLAPRLGVPAAVIDSMVRDHSLRDSLGIDSPSLEGWLAPDSYEWLPGTAPELALRAMVARTRERLAKATAGCDSLPLGLAPGQLLALASIVESEAQVDAERPHIARAYLNRIVRGMRLQADPTVGYALGHNPRWRLSLKELRFESPYNTYLHNGLPPGPICSPGFASIEAVVNATPGSDDMYFVARGDGRHLFAATYEQHLANIQATRAVRAALGALRAAEDSVRVAPPADSARPDTARPPARSPAPSPTPRHRPAAKRFGPPVKTGKH